jgi:hypothetical protein
MTPGHREPADEGGDASSISLTSSSVSARRVASTTSLACATFFHAGHGVRPLGGVPGQHHGGRAGAPPLCDPPYGRRRASGPPESAPSSRHWVQRSSLGSCPVASLSCGAFGQGAPRDHHEAPASFRQFEERLGGSLEGAVRHLVGDQLVLPGAGLRLLHKRQVEVADADLRREPRSPRPSP